MAAVYVFVGVRRYAGKILLTVFKLTYVKPLIGHHEGFDSGAPHWQHPPSPTPFTN
jgi:hypothetical protein